MADALKARGRREGARERGEVASGPHSRGSIQCGAAASVANLAAPRVNASCRGEADSILITLIFLYVGQLWIRSLHLIYLLLGVYEAKASRGDVSKVECV